MRLFQSLFCLFIFHICFSLNLSAQKGNPAQAGDKSLEVQHTEMVDASNRYQKFRVVPYEWLMAFQGNLQDSMKTYASGVNELKEEISDKAGTIEKHVATIAERDAEIVQLKEEKDGISLLGNNVSKATYSTVLWGLIGLLFAGVLFFLARGRYAVAKSQELEIANKELSENLESSRKQRLKIEQDLKRKLQDEINKRG